MGVLKVGRLPEWWGSAVVVLLFCLSLPLLLSLPLPSVWEGKGGDGHWEPWRPVGTEPKDYLGAKSVCQALL